MILLNDKVTLGSENQQKLYNPLISFFFSDLRIRIPYRKNRSSDLFISFFLFSNHSFFLTELSKSWSLDKFHRTENRATLLRTDNNDQSICVPLQRRKWK